MTPHSASGAPSADTAGHLSDLEARYDAHVAALRRHAAQLQAGVARDADALAERAAPSPELEPDPDSDQT